MIFFKELRYNNSMNKLITQLTESINSKLEDVNRYSKMINLVATQDAKAIRKFINEKKLSVDVEIDGGINFENCSKAKDASANILVSGSTIFKENKGDLKKNIEILRNN